MPRVLVTGASGFIAGHCIAELLEHGYTVRGTVRDLARAQVAHLPPVELVAADLQDDAGWAKAMAGCDYVWHLASPVPARMPRDEREVVAPAVRGTRRVLRAAAAAGVRRVVLTSSTDAVVHGHAGEPRPLGEDDWSDTERATPYVKSKVQAERAAWALAAELGVELVTVLPGLVLGPLLRPERPTSLEVVRLLLSRELPAVPRLSFAVVDVRDVARAHRLAMEAPQAAGRRYIVAGPPLWMGGIAEVLARRFGPRVPTRALPYPVMWVKARFDAQVRLALSYYGVRLDISAERARRELGWAPRPAEEAIVAAGESLIRHGVVPTPARGRGSGSRSRRPASAARR